MAAGYYRTFVTMSPEETGCEISGSKKPLGLCKIEYRGKIGRLSMTLQNLKYYDKGVGSYNCMLISQSDDYTKVYSLGNFMSNTRGRVDITYDFDPQNINETKIQDYQAVCVAFLPEKVTSDQQIVIALTGYQDKNTKLNWRPGITNEIIRSLYGKKPFLSNQSIDEQDLSAHNTKQNDGIVQKNDDQKEQEIKVNMGNYSENRPVGLDSWADEKYNKYKNDEVMKVNDKDESTFKDTADRCNNNQETGQNEYKQQNADSNGNPDDNKIGIENKNGYVVYWDGVKDYFSNLFSENSLVHPFEEDISDSEWIKVQCPGMYGSNYQQYPYSGYMRPEYDVYDHYLVGIVREQTKVKYICYGIPGRYSILPPAGLKGFSKWLPAKGWYGMGYWIMYVDAIQGDVVYPY